jgi:hypothetical protein
VASLCVDSVTNFTIKMYNRCTGIYKFGNNTCPQHITQGSILGDIFQEKSLSYGPANTVTSGMNAGAH